MLTSWCRLPYALRAASAALNRGTDAGITTGFEGEPRPRNGGFDAGCDELFEIPEYKHDFALWLR